jgi:hypothetical protein
MNNDYSFRQEVKGAFVYILFFSIVFMSLFYLRGINLDFDRPVTRLETKNDFKETIEIISSLEIDYKIEEFTSFETIKPFDGNIGKNNPFISQ